MVGNLKTKSKTNLRNVAKCSKATPKKQAGLSNFLSFHLRLTEQIFRKYNKKQDYIYIDMNAGSGVNEEVNVPGSPMIFIDALTKHNEHNIKDELPNINLSAFFIDLNEEYACNLKRIFNENECTPNKFHVMNGDHNEILPQLISDLKFNNHYGLIYHDPNGMPSFDIITNTFLNKKSSKLDLLLRVSATSIKRVRKAYPDDHKTLFDYIQAINKTTWLIGQVEEKDPFQWTFLFGCNYANLRDWKKAGFYRLDSEKGQEILQTLNLTKEELNSLNALKKVEIHGT